MNKKSIRIAGWALGLSMAVAGIGIAASSLSSATGAFATDYDNKATLAKVDLKTSQSSATDWTYTSASLYCGSATSAGKNGTLDVTYSFASFFDTNSIDLTVITESKLTITLGAGHNGGSGGVTLTMKNGTETVGTPLTETDSFTKNTSASNNNSSYGYVFTDLGSFDAVQITAGAKYYLTSFAVTFEYNLPASGNEIKPLTITAKDGGSAVGESFAFTGHVGESKQFSADITYSADDGFEDGKKVSWTSSDETIATVSGTGLVKVLGKGTTTITVATTDATEGYDNISASFTLDTTGALDQKGSSYETAYSVADAFEDFDDLTGSSWYITGYITSFYTDKNSNSYAYITDSINPKESDPKFEIYTKLGEITFEVGDADDYILGTKIVAYGEFKLFNTTHEMTGAHVYIDEIEDFLSLNVSTLPTKLTYAPGEFFDPTGLELELTYNYRTDTVAYVGHESDFSFYPSLETALAKGDIQVIGTYGGTDFDIDIVVDDSVHTDSIAIKLGGEAVEGKAMNHALDAGDLQFTADVNPTETVDAIEWTSSDETLAIVIDGEVVFGEKEGTVRITAKSGDATDYVDITITEPSDAKVSKIAIEAGENAVTKYYKGETEPDTTDLSVTATFASENVSGWTKKVEDFTDKIEWTLNREGGFVVARYDHSGEIYDIFEVTVTEQERPASYVIEYTDTTKSGNLSAENNNASVFGLDERVWNVESDKCSASNEVGLNKGKYIALYCDKTNGNGTKMTVSSEVAIISKITLDINQSATFEVHALEGGEDTKVTGVDNVFEINAHGFYIQNTQTGTNVQLRLNGINVEYSFEAEYKAVLDFEKEYVLRGIAYPSEVPTGVSGTDCLPVVEGGKSYYGDAVAHYESLSDEARIYFATREEFASARARLIAWAAANSKTISFDTLTGNIVIASARNANLGRLGRDGGSIALVSIVLAAGALAAGGLLLLNHKKRKQD